MWATLNYLNFEYSDLQSGILDSSDSKYNTFNFLASAFIFFLSALLDILLMKEDMLVSWLAVGVFEALEDFLLPSGVPETPYSI